MNRFATRLPPPSGNPPAYTRFTGRLAGRNLRPVVIITSIVGVIYGLGRGVPSLQDRGDDGETSKMQIFDLIMAILYFVVAGIEIFATVVGLLQSLSLARVLPILAPIGVALVLGVEVLGVVFHFVFKSESIAQCVTAEKNSASEDLLDLSGDQEQAITDLCDNLWSRGSYTVFAWLIIPTAIAIFFAIFALAYYHQLLDPRSGAERNTAHQSFQMQNQNQNYPPPPPGAYNNQNQNQNPQGGIHGFPPTNQESWMVPAYPGPPPGPGPSNQRGYEKNDYHPEAEWAQAEPLANNSNAPLARSGSGGNREEEEAWLHAQQTGVTAHLTGHAPSRRQEEEGYVVANREEDEAWERARSEGVTAHLTGTGTGRRGDGAV